MDTDKPEIFSTGTEKCTPGRGVNYGVEAGGDKEESIGQVVRGVWIRFWPIQARGGCYRLLGGGR